MTSTVQTSAVAPATNRFYVLDGLRGIGAMFVMFYHYTDSAHYSFLRGAWFAVDMFFFLSGFVIYHAYANKILGGMTAGVYVNRRLARLAPTVTVGVLLGAGAILLHYAAINQAIDPVKFAIVHIGNILFIPAFLDYHIPAIGLGPLFPTNTPLWSIFFEMVVSLGFVILVRWSKMWLAIATIATFIIFFLSCLWLSQTTGRPLTGDLGWSIETFFYGFPRAVGPFICGMLIYSLTQGPGPLNRTLPIWRNSISAYIIYAGLFAILLFPIRLNGLYPFIALSILTPLLILFGARSQPKSRWLVALSDWLGQVSFPLYCFHVPLRRLTESTLDAVGLTDMRWRDEMLLSFAVAILVSSLIMIALNRLRAGRRVSTWLKPITG